MTAQKKGLSLAGQAFFGSLCVGTFGLGVWQTQRYFEKVDQVAQRQSDLAQDPVLPQNYKEDLQTKPSFRRFQLTGRWDHQHEMLVGPRGPPPGALPEKPGSSAAGMSSAPQGYHVITPLLVDSNENSNNNDNNNNNNSPQVILVNRGWVPRNYVVEERRRQAHHKKQQQQSSSQSLLLQWDRPEGVASVTVVPAKFEKPKSFLVAQHDFQVQPPRLFWMDPVAFHVAAGLPFPETTQDQSPFVTAVQHTNNDNNDAPVPSLTLPLPPSAQKVGDFHVTPATHVGYGLTWYGLSAAGMAMTRKLMKG